VNIFVLIGKETINGIIINGSFKDVPVAIIKMGLTNTEIDWPINLYAVSSLYQ